ncbi:Protein ROOT PRIMORDIUM DEFECTIVE 1 [Linum perenne]
MWKSSRISSSCPKLGSPEFPFGPFNLFIQKRWKKPANTAQTRLENRTRDSKLDKLTANLRKVKIILNIHDLMANRKRGPFVSVQLMSRWRNIVGLNVGVSEFIQKYPHIFEIFPHPIRRNLCCRITSKMKDLMSEEAKVTKECELEVLWRLKKLLMMSKNGTLHVHALRMIRRELGLPEDFRDSILDKYRSVFQMVDLEIVKLVSRDESLGLAEIEKWREKEYKDKWLSELETKYAFPIHYPTGFKIKGGLREQMRNWQRVPYLKPYEKIGGGRIRGSSWVEQCEKRAVAMIHELLSLTVEKRVEVQRIAHFKKDFGMEMEVNLRELLLKHPGIFYISTKGSTQLVFLREAYAKGCLVESNPIYVVRKKMLDLILVGRRNTKELQCSREEDIERMNNLVS